MGKLKGIKYGGKVIECPVRLITLQMKCSRLRNFEKVKIDEMRKQNDLAKENEESKRNKNKEMADGFSSNFFFVVLFQMFLRNEIKVKDLKPEQR